MAAGDDLRKAHSRNGRETTVSWVVQHLDHAGRKSPRYGTNWYQDASRFEDSGAESGGHPASWRAGTADPLSDSGDALHLRGTRFARLLSQRRSEPCRSGSLRSDYRGRATGGNFGNRRRNGRREWRGPRAVSRGRPVQAWLQGQPGGIATRTAWPAP